MTCKDAVNSDSNSDEKESHLVSEDTRLNNTPKQSWNVFKNQIQMIN
jgi:hypothetical protein